MNIVYLGHAGFLVETGKTMIIMDPWVSKSGAFDGSWFQFPCNHHMDAYIIDKIQNTSKNVYLYISHEHKDHFDIEFLKRLNGLNFKYIIPQFRRTVLFDLISSVATQEIILCEDNAKISLNEDNEYVKIYTNDSELNRDSAILYSCDEQKFLNINDCKIIDRLSTIKEEEGKINVFAGQFSGATWHPVCYDYTPKKYAQVSAKKKFSKFESVALAIEKIAPDVYIPSAGPAVFLDPKLIDINFQPSNTFPRNPEIIQYLNKRLKTGKPEMYNVAPGDVITVNDVITVSYESKERVKEEDFKEYILAYASRYESFFRERIKTYTDEQLSEIVHRLVDEYKDKLSNFPSRDKVLRSLYIEFHDYPDIYIKIDFQGNNVARTYEKPYGDYYLMKTYSYDIKRVLDGLLTWEDYALTFRVRLNREPDVYQVLMQGFLLMEKEDMNHFCEHILSIQNRTERITVEVGGCRYSIDRYCPHEGGDMKHAWAEEGRFLVCSRHRWSFDLEAGGICHDNSGTINAIPLEEN
jgi:UDP-MurNAc hydroxylase